MSTDTLDLAMLREFAEAQRRVKALEAELAEAKEDAERYKTPIREALINAGIGSQPLGDGVIVHLHSQGYAGTAEGLDPHEAAQALIDGGYGDYVSPNTQKLGSLVREHGGNDDADAALDSLGMRGVIRFTVKHDVRVKGLKV